MFYSMFMTWKLGTMLFFFTSVIFFFLFWNWVKKRLTGENICLCFFSARKFISPECYYRLVSYYNFVFCQLKRKKSFRKAILASSQARKWITRKIKHEEKSHIFLSDLDQILQKPWGTSEDFFVLLVIHFLQPVFFSSVFVKLRTGKKKKKKTRKKKKEKKRRDTSNTISCVMSGLLQPSGGRRLFFGMVCVMTMPYLSHYPGRHVRGSWRRPCSPDRERDGNNYQCLLWNRA